MARFFFDSASWGKFFVIFFKSPFRNWKEKSIDETEIDKCLKKITRNELAVKKTDFGTFFVSNFFSEFTILLVEIKLK